MSKIKQLQEDYQKLDEGEKLLFLRHLCDIDKWKLEFVVMPESLQRFYKSDRRKDD